MDHDSRVLIRVGSSLGCDGVLLVGHGSPCIYIAVLNNSSGVTKDEIYGTINVAFFVELTLGVDVEGVLISFKAATVKDGEVGSGSEGNCLVLLWSGCVFKCYASCYEPVP